MSEGAAVREPTAEEWRLAAQALIGLTREEWGDRDIVDTVDCHWWQSGGPAKPEHLAALRVVEAFVDPEEMPS